MSQVPTLREMMDNGVHFGHAKSRWNPKMKPYIFTTKDKVHIINLEETQAKLKEAVEFLAGVTRGGGEVLFVGTKKQAKDIVKNAALRCGMPFMVERWFGGALTNFSVLRGNVKTLEGIEAAEEAGKYAHLTKKERLIIDEKKAKLLAVHEGVRTMTKQPAALVVVDACHEKIAISEARVLKIPVVCLIDTNANPGLVQFPIPANDDSLKALTLIYDVIGQAIKESRVAPAVKAEKLEEKEKSDKEA